MRSRPILVLLAGCAAAIVALALAGVASRSQRAFTLGVSAVSPAVTLPPGKEVCEEPIRIPDAASSFDRVAFTLGAPAGPAGPIGVSVRTDQRELGRGRLAGGFSGGPRTFSVGVGHIDSSEPMRACVRNGGTTKLAVYGNSDLASRTSTAVVDGKEIGVDISFAFDRDHSRSALSMLPKYFARASLWRAGWVGAWTYWLLGALVLLAVPALLAVALRDVTRT